MYTLCQVVRIPRESTAKDIPRLLIRSFCLYDKAASDGEKALPEFYFSVLVFVFFFAFSVFVFFSTTVLYSLRRDESFYGCWSNNCSSSSADRRRKAADSRYPVISCLTAVISVAFSLWLSSGFEFFMLRSVGPAIRSKFEIC